MGVRRCWSLWLRRRSGLGGRIRSAEPRHLGEVDGRPSAEQGYVQRESSAESPGIAHAPSRGVPVLPVKVERIFGARAGSGLPRPHLRVGDVGGRKKGRWPGRLGERRCDTGAFRGAVGHGVAGGALHRRGRQIVVVWVLELAE